MLRTLTLTTLVGTTLIAAAAPALAQGPQTNPTVPVPPPTATSPNVPTTPPEKIAPADPNLSGRLSQQKVSITPPNVDPCMAVTPPRNLACTTPVITPPGSPGGNGSVIPK